MQLLRGREGFFLLLQEYDECQQDSGGVCLAIVLGIF